MTNKFQDQFGLALSRIQRSFAKMLRKLRLQKIDKYVNTPRMLRFIPKIFLIIFLWQTSLDARPGLVLDNYVTDEASIFSEETKTRLRERLRDLEESTTAQVFILTVLQLDGESLESFAHRVAEDSKIGQEKADNGVLILLAVNDRKVRIEVGYGLEGVLSDIICNRITRDYMIPHFKNGDLAKGLEEGSMVVSELILGHHANYPNLYKEEVVPPYETLFGPGTFNSFWIVLGILTLLGVLHFLFTGTIFYKKNKILWFLYAGLSLSLLAYFLLDGFVVCLLIGLFGFTFYSLYGDFSAKSYLFTFLCFVTWVSTFVWFFAQNFELTFVWTLLIFTPFVFFKIHNDADTLGPWLDSLSKKKKITRSDLTIHALVILSTVGLFTYYFISDTSFLKTSILVFFAFALLYGFFFQHGSRSTRVYVILTIISILFFGYAFSQENDLGSAKQNGYGIYTFLLLWIFPTLMFQRGKVDSWNLRHLLYLGISLFVLFVANLDWILGFETDWSYLPLFLVWPGVYLAHGIRVIWNEADTTSGSSSSTYSSSSSSSSSYRYSSSSSSSSSYSGYRSGGGGSFGGGGSSGSW